MAWPCGRQVNSMSGTDTNDLRSRLEFAVVAARAPRGHAPGFSQSPVPGVGRAGPTNSNEGQKVEYEPVPGQGGKSSAENLVSLD